MNEWECKKGQKLGDNCDRMINILQTCQHPLVKLKSINLT